MIGGNPPVFADVWHQLYLRGHKPKKIIRVESAGESLTGDTTVIFVNSDREAMTAYVGSEEVPRKRRSDPEEWRLIVAVVPGWPIEIPA